MNAAGEAVCLVSQHLYFCSSSRFFISEVYRFWFKNEDVGKVEDIFELLSHGSKVLKVQDLFMFLEGDFFNC